MAMNRQSRLALAGSAGLLAATVAVVGAYEGLRTTAYRDVVGIPTVCFGETRGIDLGDQYTVAECKTMLGDRLIEFSVEVDRCLNEEMIPDKSYTAMVSLAYNIGSRAFCRSSVVKRANAGDLRSACEAFLMWNRAGGRVIRGLVLRRREERKMCLEGGGLA